MALGISGRRHHHTCRGMRVCVSFPPTPYQRGQNGGGCKFTAPGPVPRNAKCSRSLCPLHHAGAHADARVATTVPSYLMSSTSLAMEDPQALLPLQTAQGSLPAPAPTVRHPRPSTAHLHDGQSALMMGERLSPPAAATAFGLASSSHLPPATPSPSPPPTLVPPPPG